MAAASKVPDSWEDDDCADAGRAEAPDQEERTEDMFQDGPFLEVKVDSWEALPALSKQLIERVQRSMFDHLRRIPAGRLEFNPSTMKLRLTTSSVVWFDKVVQWRGKSKAMQEALLFLSATRETVLPETATASSENCEVVIDGRPLCRFELKKSGSCWKFPKQQCTDYMHGAGPEEQIKAWVCRHASIATDDGSRVSCHQWQHPQLKIEPSEFFQHHDKDQRKAILEGGGRKDYVLLQARRQLQRDLLVFPQSHKTNAQMAANDKFWSVLKLVYDELNHGDCQPSVDCIAFNFGTWESREHGNPHALDCHAHAHVLLTKYGVEKLAARFPIFYGRTDTVEQYRLKDCLELEQERLFGHTMIQMATFNDRLQNIEKQLSQLMAVLLPRSELNTDTSNANEQEE